MGKSKKLLIIFLLIIFVLSNRVIAIENSEIFNLVKGLFLASEKILGDGEEDYPKLSVTYPDEDNWRTVKIVAESINDRIDGITYSKIVNGEPTEEQLIDNMNVAGKTVTITTTFQEDGIYEVYAVDTRGYCTSTRFWTSTGFVISVEETSKEDKTINFVLTDNFFDITRVEVTNRDTSEKTTLQITPGKIVNAQYTGEYGRYQLDVYDNFYSGNHKIYNFVLGDAPTVSYEKDNNNHRIITFNAESGTDIELVKYAKKATKDEKVDFSTTGYIVEIIPSKSISFTLEFLEDGIYDVYFENTLKKGFTQTVNAYLEYPISLQGISKQDKTIQFNAIGTLSNISEVIIGGQPVDITPARIVTVTYVAPNYGTYEVIVRDELGIELKDEVTFNDSTKQVSGIEIDTLPTQTTYIQNVDTINLAGGKIKVNYSNDTSEVISMMGNGVSVRGFDNTILGEQTITVTYEGKTTTFKVMVRNELTRIEMKSLPNKVIYIKGESLDLTGGKITATYENRTTQDIAITNNMVSGYNSNNLGQQTITVTYEGKTTTFSVNIEPIIRSEKYIVSSSFDKVSGINPNTTVSDFLRNTTIGVDTYEVRNPKGEKVIGEALIGTGAKLKINSNEEITLVVKADTNGDGLLDVRDLAKVVFHLIDKEMLTGVYEEAANIDGKDGLDIVDLSNMVLVIVDKISL